MPDIVIPHLADHYHEVVDSIPSIQTVFHAAFASLQRSLWDTFQKELHGTEDDADVEVTLQILGRYQGQIGPRYLSYAYVMALTGAIEKNAKVLSIDGFPIPNKRQLVVAARLQGELVSQNFDDMDGRLDDLFELRNFISHSNGFRPAEPLNTGIVAILARIPQIRFDWEGFLEIDVVYLDQIAASLQEAYCAIAHAVYK